MFNPIIKWSGSKRSQAEAIIARMPRKIDTYYEPFCGGCSVLYRLLQTPEVSVGRYVASDINPDLIALWTLIKACPEVLIEGYAQMWKEFNEDPYADERLYQRSTSELYAHRKEYFKMVRDRFNKGHSAIDFFFLMRTATNGMPRYNGEGKFNSSCHFSRAGIHPSRLAGICKEWSGILNARNVYFIKLPYDAINPSPNDLAYCDPPYASIEGHKMYAGGIELNRFFEWLRSLKCRWMLSFDGKRGEKDCTYAVPEDIYSGHVYLRFGASSFARYLGSGMHEEVFESLYMNFSSPIVS